MVLQTFINVFHRSHSIRDGSDAPNGNRLRYLVAMSRRLAEVAHNVGVSEATVSWVLNNKPVVAESTQCAALTALDVLG